MEIIKKRRAADIVRGLFLLCHPGPILLHTVAVTVFALLAAWPHVAWRIIFLVVAAHVAMQLSIAVLNDYCDRSADAAGRKRKPIPLSLVTPREALLLGLLLIVVMIVLLLPLNIWALLISLLYLALGQGYNLGLKSTPLSGIVFALAIPLIPVYAFVGVGHVLPLMFWLVPVAALLGIAINLANSLPDIEDDAASGARTLAVTLGVRGSFLLCSLLPLLSIILIAILALTHTVVALPVIILPTLLCATLLVVILFALFSVSKSIQTRKVYFYFIVLTCLLLAGGWIIGAIA